jgi:hypothetical protein
MVQEFEIQAILHIILKKIDTLYDDLALFCAAKLCSHHTGYQFFCEAWINLKLPLNKYYCLIRLYNSSSLGDSTISILLFLLLPSGVVFASNG